MSHVEGSVTKLMTRSNAPVLERLGRWPVPVTWFVIGAYGLCLHVLDIFFPTVGVGPIFIPAIALATWRLGARWGIFVAAVAIALNAATMARTGDGGLSGIFLVRGLIRVGVFLSVIGIVALTRGAYQREREACRKDALTGAANRIEFEERLERWLSLAKTRRTAMLLGVIDLDDFKAINDRHGHAGGDAVLRGFVRGALDHFRGGDCFARTGGDEFTLLAEMPTLVSMRTEGRKIHERLAAIGAGLPNPVAFSMGMMMVSPNSDVDRETILHAADALMYRVKRSGKASMLIEAFNGEAAEPANDPL